LYGLICISFEVYSLIYSKFKSEKLKHWKSIWLVYKLGYLLSSLNFKSKSYKKIIVYVIKINNKSPFICNYFPNKFIIKCY